MEIRSSRSKSCYIHRLFRSFGSKFLVDESAHSRLAHITNLRGGEPTLNEPSKHFRGENRVTVFLSQIFSCFRILLLLLLHFRQPFARSLGIWGDRWQPPKSWDLKRHAPWEETVVAFGTPFSVGDTGRDFRGNMWLPRMGEEDHPPGNGRVKVESFRLGGKSSRPLSLIQLSPLPQIPWWKARVKKGSRNEITRTEFEFAWNPVVPPIDRSENLDDLSPFNWPSETGR